MVEVDHIHPFNPYTLEGNKMNFLTKEYWLAGNSSSSFRRVGSERNG